MSFTDIVLAIHPSWNVYMSYIENEHYNDWVENLTYKCSWGRTCVDEKCIYLHPGQQGYRNAPYYQNPTPCYYETETTACRLKCGQSNGRYCPFTHCVHASMEHISIRCPRPDCQRHCPHCV